MALVSLPFQLLKLAAVADPRFILAGGAFLSRLRPRK
jgi:hypothetical protein